jgi:hypothetical protein
MNLRSTRELFESSIGAELVDAVLDSVLLEFGVTYTDFAEYIVARVPESTERDLALQRLYEAVQWANTAIKLHTVIDDDYEEEDDEGGDDYSPSGSGGGDDDEEEIEDISSGDVLTTTDGFQPFIHISVFSYPLVKIKDPSEEEAEDESETEDEETPLGVGAIDTTDIARLVNEIGVEPFLDYFSAYAAYKDALPSVKISFPVGAIPTPTPIPTPSPEVPPVSESAPEPEKRTLTFVCRQDPVFQDEVQVEQGEKLPS